MKETHFMYYPGCTLHTKAKNLDESTKVIANHLGIQLDELPEWVCCGAVPPLVTDNIMNLLAPIRNLVNAGKRGNILVTTCSFCYNMLKVSNKIIQDEADKREKINNYLEERYEGNIKVLHLLEVLRDKIGFDHIRKRIRVSLTNLKVSPYYGCLLLRPSKMISLDNPNDPRIIGDLLRSLGCYVTDFPYYNECCGSYLAVSSRPIAVERARIILTSAVKSGAEVVVVSCPLCHFNLDRYQGEIKRRYNGFTEIPVLYFTQILGVAFGEATLCGLDQHYVDPRPLLRTRGFLY